VGSLRNIYIIYIYGQDMATLIIQYQWKSDSVATCFQFNSIKSST